MRSTDMREQRLTNGVQATPHYGFCFGLSQRFGAPEPGRSAWGWQKNGGRKMAAIFIFLPPSFCHRFRVGQRGPAATFTVACVY
jgi:hypothetical protein